MEQCWCWGGDGVTEAALVEVGGVVMTLAGVTVAALGGLGVNVRSSLLSRSKNGTESNEVGDGDSSGKINCFFGPFFCDKKGFK